MRVVDLDNLFEPNSEDGDGPYWDKRLRSRSYDRVVLTRGYPKGGGVEGVTRLTRQYYGWVVVRITHPHFGPEPVRVYAIDVSTPDAAESHPQ